MGLAVAIVIFLALAAAAWLVYSAVAAKKAVDAPIQRDSPRDPGVETLRYAVPDHQDPAVLIAALDQAGYGSELEEERGDKLLAVACPAGRDRERARVRAVIGETNTTGLEGPSFDPGTIRFEDEQ